MTGSSSATQPPAATPQSPRPAAGCFIAGHLVAALNLPSPARARPLEKKPSFRGSGSPARSRGPTEARGVQKAPGPTGPPFFAPRARTARKLVPKLRERVGSGEGSPGRAWTRRRGQDAPRGVFVLLQGKDLARSRRASTGTGARRIPDPAGARYPHLLTPASMQLPSPSTPHLYPKTSPARKAPESGAGEKKKGAGDWGA